MANSRFAARALYFLYLFLASLLSSGRTTLVFYLYFAHEQSLANSAAKCSCKCAQNEADRSSACADGTPLSSTLPYLPRFCSSLLRTGLLRLRCRLVGAWSCLRTQLGNLLLNSWWQLNT